MAREPRLTIVNNTTYFPVMLPAGYDGDKRRKRYCKTKTEAKELKAAIHQWKINRRRPQDTFRASEAELGWIGYLRAEKIDLSRLPEIISTWRAVSRDVKEKLRCEVAADRYVEWRTANSKSETTLKDIRSRVNRFKVHFLDRPLIDLAPADIREYLETRNHATSRHNDFKVLSPFFKWAKLQRFIAINPLTELTKPPADQPEPLRLTAQAFSRLLRVGLTLAPEKRWHF